MTWWLLQLIMIGTLFTWTLKLLFSMKTSRKLCITSNLRGLSLLVLSIRYVNIIRPNGLKQTSEVIWKNWYLFCVNKEWQVVNLIQIYIVFLKIERFWSPWFMWMFCCSLKSTPPKSSGYMINYWKDLLYFSLVTIIYA